MGKKFVSIIGRPNVGKSSLFNRIVGKRINIVDDEPGVTRDRLYQETNWNGESFLLSDTGGLVPNSKKGMLFEIRMQVEEAIKESSCLVLVVDGKAGIQDLDLEIARGLRRQKKEVLLVVNKLDAPEKMDQGLSKFRNMGFPNLFPISAIHGLGIGDFLDSVVDILNADSFSLQSKEIGSPTLKIAIAGRPNVGKSSLINFLAKSYRVIVSPIPGTTRDSVNVEIEISNNGVLKKYSLIDTAGLRKKARIKDDVEYFSTLRTTAAFSRADVILILLDAETGLESQDLKILTLAREHKKGMVLGVNKWDLVDKKTGTLDSVFKNFIAKNPFLEFVPKISLSAETGQRVEKIPGICNSVFENMHKRIPDEVLKEFSKNIFNRYPHPVSSGRTVRMGRIFQVGIIPPVFCVTANWPKHISESYKRFIANQLFKRFDFSGCPVQFFYKRERIKRPEIQETLLENSEKRLQ